MPRMPPRKEAKETVVYPSSKRKAPAFKPQRPSKVPRVPTTESESSKPKATTKPAAKRTPKKTVQAEEDEDEDAESVTAGAVPGDSDSELDDNPLATKSKAKKPLKSQPAVKKKPPARDQSPLSISSQEPTRSSPPPANAPPPPTQLSDPTQIPQPLLLRLLHEHFADKSTKIDKHAIQVLQKYMEVFVREAIARTALQKKEATERGDASAADAGWLELEDLEKVAAGMMLDF